MKESKDRTEQFMYSTANAVNQAPTSVSLLKLISLLRLNCSIGSLLFNSQRNDPMGDGSLSRQDSKGKGKGRAPQNGDVLALDLGSAEEGTGAHNGGAFMQMQLVEQQVRHPACLLLPRWLTSFSGFIHTVSVNCYRVH
jgi:syntaxin 5